MSTWGKKLPTTDMTLTFLGTILLASFVSCASPNPAQELEIMNIETYWAIDSSVESTQYLAPVVRFQVKNKGQKLYRSVEATAAFRRKGEESQTWGSDWQRLAYSGKPLLPEQHVAVMLKSDARYSSVATPEAMFEHKLFKDVKVQVFLKIDASAWAKMVEVGVERRIGSRGSGVP